MKYSVLVFIGGGIGSVVRYLVSLAIPWSSNSFPVATFTVNAVGSFLIGMLVAFCNVGSEQTATERSLQFFLVAGFCGGFTTFSTFSLESFRLLQQHQYLLFSMYIVLSLLVCLLFTGIGFSMMK